MNTEEIRRGMRSLGMYLMALVSVLTLTSCIGSFAMGCGYGKAACTVVDVAKEACTVVKYMAPDGTVREVTVPREELSEFAHGVALKRAAAARATATPTAAPSAAPDAGK